MTPYTDEQKADLAKRIEARAERYAGERNYASAAALEYLAQDIRDGSFFEVRHD